MPRSPEQTKDGCWHGMRGQNRQGLLDEATVTIIEREDYPLPWRRRILEEVPQRRAFIPLIEQRYLAPELIKGDMRPAGISIGSVNRMIYKDYA